MAGTLLVLNLFYLLIILISSGAQGVHIQAYRHLNFTGLLWESNSSAVCSNIPEDKIANTNSIRTDTCFIAYNRHSCRSYWSQKYMPGDTVVSSRDLRVIRSFNLCNDEEGGSQLNLDITTYYDHRYADDVREVLESYKNVCSCVNVPQYVQNMDKWSITNHHNALLAYYEPGCSENKWNSIFIPAGHNWDSRNMHRHERTDSVTKTTYKIQSFGPDPNSTYFQTGCKLEALSYKFVELQKQSKQRQDNFERAIESILKQHKDDINSLTQNITQLHQESRNFTAKIRSDLSEFFL